jgi:hypothetical protein
LQKQIGKISQSRSSEDETENGLLILALIAFDWGFGTLLYNYYICELLSVDVAVTKVMQSAGVLEYLQET